jgi:small subunit ribosomal protein S13
MIYILNNNLNEKKNVFIMFKNCYGISNKSSLCLISKFGLNFNIKYEQIPLFLKTNIEASIDSIVENIFKMQLGRVLKFIEESFLHKLFNLKCYRTLRHKQFLPVRGQRTHSNAQTQKSKLKNRLKILKVRK